MVAAIRVTSTDARRGGSASSPPRTPAASRCAPSSARAACSTCRSENCCRGSASGPSAARREEHCGRPEGDDHRTRARPAPDEAAGRARVKPADAPQPRPVMPRWLKYTLAGLILFTLTLRTGAADPDPRVRVRARRWGSGSCGGAAPGVVDGGDVPRRRPLPGSGCSSPVRRRRSWFLFFAAWIFVIVAVRGREPRAIGGVRGRRALAEGGPGRQRSGGAVVGVRAAEGRGALEPGRGFEPRTPSLPWRCSAS